MLLLIAGLILFLGMHSIRIYADNWRTAKLNSWGVLKWQAVYSLVSLLGLILIIYGYGAARIADPSSFWSPAPWLQYVTAFLMLVSFVFISAADVPGNSVKARLGHPMLIGVKLWAFSHLLSNARLADVVLFGAFLIWSILAFRAARRRDADSASRVPGSVAGNAAVVVVAVSLWTLFLVYLHQILIGVAIA